MTIDGKVSLSLLPAARQARSVASLANVLSRARERAERYAWLLADWPALVEFVRRDAQEIETLLYERPAR